MRSQMIEIPKGHAYLTGIRMKAGSQLVQVIPELDGSNTEWIVGDNRVIQKNVPLNFDPPSFTVEFLTYNEDDTYEHAHYIDLE